jgi:hypothetical protein
MLSRVVNVQAFVGGKPQIPLVVAVKAVELLLGRPLSTVKCCIG